MSSATEQLRETIAAYNDAWNAHDVRPDRRRCTRRTWCSRTTPPASEPRASEALAHIAGIFESWPDIEFETRRLYVREDLVVQEWTASGDPCQASSAAARSSPSPRASAIEWKGMDVIPFEDGKVKRKDVYSDSVSILRQVGLL